MDKKELGERIRIYRKLLDMTQAELAKKVGYKARATINMIENGKTVIKTEKLAEIATALNIEVEELLKEEVEAVPKSKQKYLNDLLEMLTKDLERINELVELIKDCNS